MNSRRCVLQGLAAALALGGLKAPVAFAAHISKDQKKRIRESSRPTATLKAADLIIFPGNVDCNSPAHWDGDTVYIFTSAGDPMRSFGADLFNLGPAEKASYANKANGARWIESTFKDIDGTLYGWYHNEPHPVCLQKHELTAPRIGAAISKDNGARWEDLGFILEAPGPLVCDTQNHYFVGGNGDFSVILDEQKKYVYFFISTYHKITSEQGIAVARMLYSDRQSPQGKVFKWHSGQWREPGIAGRVTPIFPVAIDWNKANADTFWGPSVHWNTYLQNYVILMNRAIDKDWKQEGVYLSFNDKLDKPSSWTQPAKLLDRKELLAVPKMSAGWYPQVIGINTGARETDKRAGQVARLFVHGKSVWEITFQRAGDL